MKTRKTEMGKMNKSKKGLGGFLVLFLGVLVLLQGCAADRGPVQPPAGVRDSLPPAKLAHFNDTFDSFREDLWDKSGFLFQESQMRNYKAAAMRIENGQLVIETQKGSFSKGGLVTRYSLKGDFDIQLSCRFDFQENVSSFDQVMGFGVLEISPWRGKPNRLINIALLRLGGESLESGVLSACRDMGIGPRGILGKSWLPMGDFQGSLRIVRKGSEVITFFQRGGEARWNKRGSFPSTGNDVLIGTNVQNFSMERSSISAEKPVIGRLDGFRINAAQGIVEEEI